MTATRTPFDRRRTIADEQPWWRYAVGLSNPFSPTQTALKHYRPDDFITRYGSNFAEQPFFGAHSDIGGGYQDGRNVTALYWMWNLAHAKGVPLKPIESYPDFGRLRQIETPHDSRYVPDYLFPKSRLIYGTPGG